MRHLSVQGLSADGRSLVLRSGQDTFELLLAEVRLAEQAVVPPGDGPPPSPRQIQQRIRRGENAEDIARSSGLAPAAVARYEGPVLAEREYQAAAARRARVDGRVVEDLVQEHFAVRSADEVTVSWDCWQIEPGRWEVQARSGQGVVRLRWNSSTRQVQAMDETGRQALRLGPAAQDALGAVLRPVSGRPTPQPLPQPAPVQTALPEAAPVPRPTRPARRARPQMPGWDEISTSVTGRQPDR